MSQVSRHPISSAVAERIFAIFIKTLVSVKDVKEADEFASDLFTPTEKIMLAKRIAIAFLLLRGYQYREISKILCVSLTTIASVNISIKTGNGSYKRILQKIMQEENMEEFFNNTIQLLLSPLASSSKGGTLWRHLRDEVKSSKQKKIF